MSGGYLEVTFGARAHAIAVGAIREVMRAPAIVRVPTARAAMRGLTAIRGRLVPVVDPALVASADVGEAPPPRGNERPLLVVVLAAGRAVGLLVDRVGAVTGGGDPRAPVLDVEHLMEAV